jgi:hypothetical protein
VGSCDGLCEGDFWIRIYIITGRRGACGGNGEDKKVVSYIGADRDFIFGLLEQYV